MSASSRVNLIGIGDVPIDLADMTAPRTSISAPMSNPDLADIQVLMSPSLMGQYMHRQYRIETRMALFPGIGPGLAIAARDNAT
ncbi:hypothetical protein [Sedimentitalea todarodis]|uniref:Uncharacterized protein n=1 Tax=Sedimentitalea todarodis TaxID=1631240 RepID=A0ABU3VD42_9RHOB|nr:hypothetical protein [Sedimentitalea todarodis]MDU9004098.1 hypothetical protein [Sedimentitalea todarodis]